MASRLRWIALGIFVLSTALNYLDRLLVAALAPTLKSEFQLSNAQSGGIIFGVLPGLRVHGAGGGLVNLGLAAANAPVMTGPIDFFGPRSAAFGVSILTSSYGLMQTVLSLLIGSMVDHFGFRAVCVSLSALPLAGIAILRAAAR
jgi:hypothetical protein